MLFEEFHTRFIEKGISLLRESGQFSYIVANKWMRANYGKSLRTWLSGKSIEEIIDFGDLPVFKKATTYPCILRVSNGIPNKRFKTVQIDTLDFSNLSQYVKENGHLVNRESLDDNEWSLVDQENRSLLNKLTKSGIPLGEFVEKKIYYGIKTGLNKAFVIDKVTKDRLIAEDAKSAEVIKPFLAGHEIKRYIDINPQQYLILFERGWTNKNSGNSKDKWTWLKERYPSIANHLEPFAKNGEKRYDKGDYWWELRSCDYYPEFEREKILYAEIATTGQFTLDNRGLYSDTTSYIIANNSRYLLGILNSRLWTFMFSNVSSVIRGGFFRWKRQYMEKLPIHTIDFLNSKDVAKHDKIVSLVEQMLEMNKKLDNSKLGAEKEMIKRRIKATDAEINRLVYQLYELNEEEIKIIEGK